MDYSELKNLIGYFFQQRMDLPPRIAKEFGAAVISGNRHSQLTLNGILPIFI